jgi:GABA permease
MEWSSYYATGPGAILSYGIAEVLVILLMRMIGEMAVVNPDSGSFARMRVR